MIKVEGEQVHMEGSPQLLTYELVGCLNGYMQEVCKHEGKSQAKFNLKLIYKCVKEFIDTFED